MDTLLTPVAQSIADAKRIVIKVGSALLVDNAQGLRQAWLESLGRDIAELTAGGKQIVIVSSGAIALGKGKLGLSQPRRRLSHAQAAAAVGQIALARAYEEVFATHGLTTAQILLTLTDLETRRTYLNARETLQTLLKLGALPVINENDSTATEEIRFGDNDRLAARVAQMVSADLLILLSDVDGLYTANPTTHKDAKWIAEIHEITDAIEAMASGPSVLGVGSGGMITKLAAARIATGAGCAMAIAKGEPLHPIAGLQKGEARASLFHAAQGSHKARKLWLAGRQHLAGHILADAGALKALAEGRSLLAAGITDLEGDFERGDLIAICSQDRRTLARGVTGYSAAEIRQIKGLNSSDIEKTLGYIRGRAVVHRDDLSLENTRTNTGKALSYE